MQVRPRPSQTATPAASGERSRRPQLLAGSYWAGGRILRVVPPGIRHAAATPGGSAWYWISAAQRRAALDNYAAALGREPSDPEVARVARRAFQNYGRMLMDFLLMGTLTPQELVDRVTFSGRDHLERALARGRGVIMATPHMGSWDMAGSYAGAVGYQIAAVTERFPGSLNDAVVRTRRRYGLKVIMLGRAAVRQLTEALRANQIVALLCDLEQGPGVEVRFFGRRAIVPGGPAALALKTGAELVPACQYVTAPGRHHIHLDSPLAVREGDTKEQLMQRVIDRFEQFIRERPEQWYAFRPMFRSE
ncbi:MAG TPA: lysophospholipid acyltransferase family protein [Candidatus Dormibacteraeota bacterium]|nr:lysophospholipid acyltransferase family protein [Candidatus Dormibacteraeota bacterium]